MPKRRVKTKPLKGKYTIWDPDPNLDEEEKEKLRKKLGAVLKTDVKGMIPVSGRKTVRPGRPLTRLEVQERLKALENFGRV